MTVKWKGKEVFKGTLLEISLFIIWLATLIKMFRVITGI